MTADIFSAIEKGALLLDVRPASAYAAGHIKGSQSAPKGSQSAPLEDLATTDLPEDKEQPIYVHCRLGIKSKEAKSFLEEKGYTNVVDLGSIDDMVARGFDYQEFGQ